MFLSTLRTRIHAESIRRGMGEAATSKMVEDPTGLCTSKKMSWLQLLA